MTAIARCRDLLASYPEAVTYRPGQEARSMVLMIPVSPPRFFILAGEDSPAGVTCTLVPWREGGATGIGDGAELSPGHAAALADGIPLPRDGSLFGWAPAARVTALITFTARYAPRTPEPSWAVMPLAGISRSQWPPFTREPLLGQWFWDYLRAGAIRPLRDLIAPAPGTAYWADGGGAGPCCAVTRDITAAGGTVLSAGRYACWQALAGGAHVPPAAGLVSQPGAIDLAGDPP